MKRKKFKKLNSKELLSAALASAMLLNSCSKGVETMVSGTEVNNSINYCTNLKEGQILVNLTGINFSSGFQVLMDSYKEIVMNLLIDPAEAELFKSDPNAYLSQHLSNPVQLETHDQDLKFLLALCDNEVKQELTDGDLKGFIDLCVAKGYINFDVNKYPPLSQEQIRSYFASDADYNTFLAEFNEGLNPDSSVIAFAVAIIVGVVAIVWGFVIHTAAAVTAIAGGVTFIGAVAAAWKWVTWGSSQPGQGVINIDSLSLSLEQQYNLNLLFDSNKPLKLWFAEKGVTQDSIFDLIDSVSEIQAAKYIAIYQQHNINLEPYNEAIIKTIRGCFYAQKDHLYYK